MLGLYCSIHPKEIVIGLPSLIIFCLTVEGVPVQESSDHDEGFIYQRTSYIQDDKSECARAADDNIAAAATTTTTATSTTTTSAAAAAVPKEVGVCVMIEKPLPSAKCMHAYKLF